ncbi:hypothetical protein [Roseimicrobium sp. ORNL1]|uniref:hypothetical protein n=1 Tax=Roseimicrobium sp. ORNL1 TaxID=2711231 RepID=UPI0013E12B66|nr:hypothetical protein [Roseimicrobium sp. ORNL1]QIF02982.1 hypothetical protein G5S37_16120 [Roseimicrobium sp. ORNL1]
MFGLFSKRCQTCSKTFDGRRYKWHIAGRKLIVCERCNGQLEHRAGAMRLSRGGPPSPETFGERWSGTITNIVIAALGVAAAIAIAHWRPNPQHQEATEAADAALEKAVRVAVREEAAMEDNDMLVLESKDGRTIRAQILTLTQRDVFVRRDDKLEVRVPLSQLTDASLRKVEAFRTSLSGNVH